MFRFVVLIITHVYDTDTPVLQVFNTPSLILL